jgi:hypothetical protein
MPTDRPQQGLYRLFQSRDILAKAGAKYDLGQPNRKVPEHEPGKNQPPRDRLLRFGTFVENGN